LKKEILIKGEKTMGLIYIIKNKCNNKIYIGQTTRTLESRWSQHKRAALSNT